MNLIIFPCLISYDMESLIISFKIYGKLIFISCFYLFLHYEDIIEADLLSHVKPAFQKCLL